MRVIVKEMTIYGNTFGFSNRCSHHLKVKKNGMNPASHLGESTSL
jgi:hypothetical protein